MDMMNSYFVVFSTIITNRHHSDIIWAYLKSPATWLFVQQIVMANNKKKPANFPLLALCKGNPAVIGIKGQQWNSIVTGRLPSQKKS